MARLSGSWQRLVSSANHAASLRELMDRIGHSRPRAALIYLHDSDLVARLARPSRSNISLTLMPGGPPTRHSGHDRVERASAKWTITLDWVTTARGCPGQYRAKSPSEEARRCGS